MEKEKFNQAKYIQQYKKEKYANFYIRIPKDMNLELEKKLKDLNLSKAQFLRNAIEDLLKK